MRKNCKDTSLAWYAVVAGVLAASVAVVALSSSARSQISCYPLEAVEKTLKDEYNETKSWEGKDKNGRTVRIYSDKTKRTWTLIILQDETTACLVTTGTDAERHG